MALPLQALPLHYWGDIFHASTWGAPPAPTVLPALPDPYVLAAEVGDGWPPGLSKASERSLGTTLDRPVTLQTRKWGGLVWVGWEGVGEWR